MKNLSRNARVKTVQLMFCVSDEHAVPARVPVDLDPHTLVLAACSGLLPPGVLPSRLMRGGRQVAFYNPLASLAGHAQDGDVLVCERDHGQPLNTPSMLRAYRLMGEYDAMARSRACEFGHVGAV